MKKSLFSVRITGTYTQSVRLIQKVDEQVCRSKDSNKLRILKA